MTTHPTPPERELGALLELSERATPGIWEMYGGTNHGRVQTADVIVCDGSPPHFMGKEDAKFIAALVNWFRSTRAATVPQGVSADVARMDWLEARGYPGQFYACDDGSPTEKWFDSETIGSDYSPTLRAAIDAAMNPQQGG